MISNYAFWRYLLWPQLAGFVFLVAGLISVRRKLSFKLDSMTVLGRVFVPVSLAIFGAEHLVSASFIKDMVPKWMPWHLFWAYFVGLALFAAAISILTMKHVRLSAPLLGFMLFAFVLSLHIPNVIQHPRDRFAWAVAARDLGFALGAWTLGAAQMDQQRLAGRRLLAIFRVGFALILLFFGAEHLLHPEFTPGVPLPQPTAAWIPIRSGWGYFIGAMLLLAAITLLIDKRARASTTFLGIAITAVVLFINVPMLVVASQPSEINNAVNYVGDTLLFAGTIFFIAAAIPARVATPSLVRQQAA